MSAQGKPMPATHHPGGTEFTDCTRCAALEREMRRYLPVIERAEANAGVWVMLTMGTGIATANGYRAALAAATDSKQEQTP